MNTACRCSGVRGMSESALHGTDELLAAIDDLYAEDSWPDGFSDAYAVMECLGEGQGCDTFLVQDADGGQFVAKRFDKAAWRFDGIDDILATLDHPALPRHVATFEDERCGVVVRTYVEGLSLDRYARENDLDEQGIADLVAKLCDVLGQRGALDDEQAPRLQPEGAWGEHGALQQGLKVVLADAACGVVDLAGVAEVGSSDDVGGGHRHGGFPFCCGGFVAPCLGACG